MITLAYKTPAIQLYTQVITPAGQYVRTDHTAEVYNAANWALYAVESAPTDGTGLYTVPFPSWLATPGVYVTLTYRRVGVSPVSTDRRVGWGIAEWDGSKLLDLTNGASSSLSSDQINTIAAGVASASIFTNIRDAIDNVVTVLGDLELSSGPVQVTFTGPPSTDVYVLGAGRVNTGSSGSVVAMLQAGAYTIRCKKPGWAFDDSSLIVSSPGPQSVTVTGSEIDVSGSVPSDMCVLTLYGANMNANEVATLSFVQLPQVIGGQLLVQDTQQIAMSAGKFTFTEVPQGSKISIELAVSQLRGTYTVPSSTVATLSPLSLRPYQP